MLKDIVTKPQGQFAIFGAGIFAIALLLLKKRSSQDDDEESVQDFDDPSELAHLDDHLTGLEKVFSVEANRTSFEVSGGVLKKYKFAIGLPNVANTCYMNSLLQALSGCTLFTNYVERLW